MSVVIHEISHGFIAEYFGDNTARRAGRLTLNPLKHLDLFGSIILPALLYFSAGFVFGWAKPIPYNPHNLRDRKWGTVAVASAGVLANIFIAIIFGIFMRIGFLNGISEKVLLIPKMIVEINLALALFNLVPIPPLDGSKILFQILHKSFYPVVQLLENYSLIFFVIFIAFFSNYLYPILAFLYHIITGLSL